jgi:acetyl esterase/lipase/outer membrane protein assembly factor BamB
VFTVLALAGAARSRAADQPKEILLWPADHPANQGNEPAYAGTIEWMDRITRSPAITPFLPEEDRRGGAAVVICPGGGYAGLAMEKEGLEVARWMQDRGIAGVVLRYRCGGGKNQQPVPLQDAQRAIRTVRASAKQWGVDPHRVGILGFSAGGHLASTAATMFDDGDANADDAVDRQSSRPDFAVLVYPVISMVGPAAHGGSRRNLLGDNASDELAAKWSSDQRVTDKTPPTFLVHASDDGGVPVKNSLLFYEALVAHKVPAELHVYEVGGHGFGMLRGDRPADKWPEQLEPWLKAHGLLASADGHRLLIQGKDKLAIVAADGRIEWEMPWGGVHDMHVLDNGHIMVQQGPAAVAEIDPATKKVVWSYDSAHQNGNEGKRIEVHSFQPLPDGHVMIAESGAARIIEVDRDGKIVKQFPLQVEHPEPHRDTRLVHKLDTGHYLVCHEGDGAVRQYDADGKVVWEYKVPLFDRKPADGHGPEAFGNQTFSALRLASGNTLVTTGNGHSVLEVTPAKEIVWKLDQHDLAGITLAWVTTIEVLPNGHYVIGNAHAGPTNPQVIEFDPKTKQVVWQFHRFEEFGNDVSNTLLLDD